MSNDEGKKIRFTGPFGRLCRPDQQVFVRLAENEDRFAANFVFQLTAEEKVEVVANCDNFVFQYFAAGVFRTRCHYGGQRFDFAENESRRQDGIAAAIRVRGYGSGWT